MPTIPVIPAQPSGPIEEQELTYWNQEGKELIQGTKILKEDLDASLQLVVKDLLKLRQEALDRRESGNIVPYGLYERLRNLDYEDFALEESVLMKDLIDALASTVSAEDPDGRHVSVRLDALEKMINNVRYMLLNEGNTNEQYIYDPVTDEIREILVTGDYESETRFVYHNDEAPPASQVPQDEDFLIRQETKFKNPRGQYVTVKKEYLYAPNAAGDDMNIVGVNTTTETDTTPPDVPVVLSTNNTVPGAVTINIATRVIPAGAVDDFAQYRVYEMTPTGQTLVASGSTYSVQVIASPGYHTYILKAVDNSGNISAGVEVGPIQIL